jgi:hypothetical protein
VDASVHYAILPSSLLQILSRNFPIETIRPRLLAQNSLHITLTMKEPNHGILISHSCSLVGSVNYPKSRRFFDELFVLSLP